MAWRSRASTQDSPGKVRLIKKVEILDGDAAVGDSQEHGAAENGVKTMQHRARAIRIGLEARIRAEIPEEHDIIPWMVKHGVAAKVLR